MVGPFLVPVQCTIYPSVRHDDTVWIVATNGLSESSFAIASLVSSPAIVEVLLLMINRDRPTHDSNQLFRGCCWLFRTNTALSQSTSTPHSCYGGPVGDPRQTQRVCRWCFGGGVAALQSFSTGWPFLGAVLHRRGHSPTVWVPILVSRRREPKELVSCGKCNSINSVPAIASLGPSG